VVDHGIQSASLAGVSETALQYARANPSSEWLGSVRSDREFVEQLLSDLASTSRRKDQAPMED
jgi:hypothetical protein